MKVNREISWLKYDRKKETLSFAIAKANQACRKLLECILGIFNVKAN